MKSWLTASNEGEAILSYNFDEDQLTGMASCIIFTLNMKIIEEENCSLWLRKSARNLVHVKDLGPALCQVNR